MSYPDIESATLEEWQEITNLVASLCHVPAALVMRQNRQTMEVMSGSQHPDSPYEAFETAPLNGELYCEAVIKTQSPLHIPNALNDSDWDHNPDIELGMISYYGVPVNWPDGSPFGTICILDSVEKSATDEEKEIIKRFARVIEVTLELIASNHELERSQKRYLNLIDESNDAVFLIDPDTAGILDMNKRAYGNLGYSRDELLNRSVIDIEAILPDSFSWEKHVRGLKKAGSMIIEGQHKRKDGSTFPVEVSIKYVAQQDEDYMIAIARDISERKQAEEKASALNRIIEDSLNEVYIFDAQTLKFIQANYGARLNLGYELDELEKLTPVDLKPELTKESFLKLVEPLKTGKEKKLQFTTAHRRKDGSIYPAEVNLQISTLQSRKVFIAFILDITERKEAEEALKKSEEKYRQLIEGLKDEYIFYVHDTDGVFTYISPSVQNVLGYQPEEYLIHYNDTFTDNPINQTAREKSEASIQGKRQPTYELEVRRKDNSICRLAVTETPVFNEAGEVVAVEGIAHDITEHRLAEEALELSQTRHEEAQRIAHLGHWTLDLITNEVVWSDENYRIFGVEPGSANTYDTFLETVHPDDREFVDYAYTNSLKNRTSYELEHRLLMKDGSIKWVNERCETEYADDGSPLRSMGTTQDITERKQLKDTLYFTAQRGWDIDGEDFFQALATHLAKSLQIDFVIIGKLLNLKRVKTVALYAKGKTGNNIEYSLSHTPCEKVVGNDLCYYSQGIQQLFPLDEMLVEMGAESYLGTPLWDSKGEPIGLIALIDSKPMTNESPAKALLQTVAVRVAAELERRGSDEILEKSREQLRALVESIQAVREEEQKRIARDIHDDLGQLLTAINIDVSWIEEMLAEEQKDLRTKAQEASALVSAAINKVQKISSALRPTLLDDLGITAAIEWQINEFQNRTGITCSFASTPAQIDIANNLATEIYRIFQEALTNVIRHAEATKVEVSLTKSDGRVILEVRDNGRGITEEEINAARSIGLVGIRERAYSLQGDVAIHGNPGKGSSVIVTFPTGGKR